MISRITLTALLVVAPSLVFAQDETIPEAIRRHGPDVARVVSSGSGITPSVGEVLALTDLVVRRTIQEPTCYLSDDQQDVYCDYPLADPTTIYSSQVFTSPRPGMPPSIVVTLLGGTVTIENVEFKYDNQAQPPLQVGTDGLFFLKRVGDKYHIMSGGQYGAFRIANGIVTTHLGARPDFGEEYKGRSEAQVLDDVRARMRGR